MVYAGSPAPVVSPVEQRSAEARQDPDWHRMARSISECEGGHTPTLPEGASRYLNCTSMLPLADGSYLKPLESTRGESRHKKSAQSLRPCCSALFWENGWTVTAAPKTPFKPVIARHRSGIRSVWQSNPGTGISARRPPVPVRRSADCRATAQGAMPDDLVLFRHGQRRMHLPLAFKATIFSG